MRGTSRILAVAGSLAIVLAACSSGGSSTAPSAVPASAPAASASGGASAGTGAKPYIPVISKGFQHQFWQAVKSGAEKAATELGAEITFEGPASESEVDKQIEMLQTALDKKPAAICFAALDSKAAIPLLQKAKDANIPVVGFDSGVDSDIPVTTAATDNIAAAGEAAKKMAGLIGDTGEVAIIAHDQTSRTGIDRVKGFTDEITANHPNIKIVDTQYGGGDQLKSTDLTKAIIQAHPNLKGVFGANEGSAIGVLNGVKESAAEGKITVIGYDSGKQQMDAIRAGTEAGAITQDPIGIGYKCVESALKAINGEAENKEKFVAALRQVAINDDPRGPMKMDDLNNPIQNVYIRKVERVGGKLQNTVVHTYPNVSQFWTYKQDEYLKAPAYDRNYPPCKFCD